MSTKTRWTHDDAMDLAEIGLALALNRDHGMALRYFADAYETEARAIDGLSGQPQPSYSVMCRSAATLALRCGRFEDAEAWCEKGGAADGCPPEIRDEIAEANAVAQAALGLLSFKRRCRDERTDTD